MARILVAMSGGVDSAVSAFLLKSQGHEVIGANMRFWEYVDNCDVPLGKKNISSCCSPDDLADAEKSAFGIGIPFYTLKMEGDFREKVIAPFIADYTSGLTPNPCIHCNTFIKFGEFYEKAHNLQFDKIATGHYADIIQLETGRYAVSHAKDSGKDQAYYLYGLSQESLAKTVFPLANLKKEEVRKIAEENAIPVAKKPDSQEICFIPENNYRNFLKNQGVHFQKGNIVDSSGLILGTHEGKENFTVGQRKGLGITGPNPMYVAEIRKNGDVIVGNRELALKKTFFLNDIVFQGIESKDIPHDGLPCTAQIRYNSKPVPAMVFHSSNMLKVELQEPAWAITAGQAGVLYHAQKKYILAGGKISPQEY